MNIFTGIANLGTQAWRNPWIKTILVTAAGGAFGAVAPMAMTGALVLNAATGHAAIAGAITAISALFIHKPVQGPPVGSPPSPVLPEVKP